MTWDLLICSDLVVACYLFELKFMDAVYQSRRLQFQSSFSALLDEVDAKVNRTSGQGFINTILFFTFLFFISTSTMLFRYHICTEFPEADGRTAKFIADDMSIDCNRKEWKSNFLFVMIMVSFLGVLLSCKVLPGTYENLILLTR